MTRSAGAGPEGEAEEAVAPPAEVAQGEQPTGPAIVGYDLVDEMSDETFPTSDPPSTWAGADHPRS